MSSTLSKVFSRNKGKASDSPTFVVKEPKLFTFRTTAETYYKHVFPENTSQALTVPQRLVVDVVKNSLQKKEVRNKAVPRLPSVIPRLLRSLRDPDSSAKDYVAIINKDPVMSVAVLKLANSVYFNPIGARIDEIETAVVKLGIHGLRSVLSAAVMQPIIQKNSPYFSHSGQKMWQHSLNCAVCCEVIAEHRKMERFKVYLMGLIHDIGKITIFSELCKQFEINGEEVKPGYNAFVPLMKILAPAVSYWVSKDWDLPQEISKALAEQVKLSAGAKVSAYGHLLYQANLASEFYAVTKSKKDKRADDLLKELELPATLYTSLDQLSTDL